LVLLASAAVFLEDCGTSPCVDQHYNTVDDKNCRTGSAGYHYIGSGSSGSAPTQNGVGEPGSTRGVFGAAGESAAHGGGGSGGEGAGAGE
jgi:hypothetical protein